MASSKATTAEQYLAALPGERRLVVSAVRNVILDNLPAGFEESMQFGMLGYVIPLSRHSNTYNGQPLGIAALAAQKHHYSLYLLGVYGDRKFERWFEDAFARAGKKLDKGKSCVRFKKVDDLPLDVIGQAIATVSVEQCIAMHDAAHPPSIRAKTAKPATGARKRSVKAKKRAS